MDTALLPRPFSCHAPRVPGYAPLITCQISRIGRRKRNSWRIEILVDGCAQVIAHRDTKAEAEERAGRFMEAETQAHYVSN